MSDSKLFVMKCLNTSLAPKIPNGATVIVRKQSKVEDNEIAAVLADDEVKLKQIKQQNNQETHEYILGKVIHVSYDL